MLINVTKIAIFAKSNRKSLGGQITEFLIFSVLSESVLIAGLYHMYDKFNNNTFRTLFQILEITYSFLSI